MSRSGDRQVPPASSTRASRDARPTPPPAHNATTDNWGMACVRELSVVQFVTRQTRSPSLIRQTFALDDWPVKVSRASVPSYRNLISALSP
jgi:hypothetical protein